MLENDETAPGTEAIEEMEEARRSAEARASLLTRFDDLALEAKGYGLKVVIVVMDDNPIEDTETADLLYRGCGTIVAAGMLSWGLCRVADIERSYDG